MNGIIYIISLLLISLVSCDPSFKLTDNTFKNGAKNVLSIPLYNHTSDFDKDFYNKNKSCIDSLVRFINNNPNQSIEIGVYTMQQGHPEYNIKLSIAQAQGFIFVLKTNGAMVQNLIAKGYGEKNPIFSERKIKKMKIEEQKIAHEKNGRIVLKILKK